jgi:hypothetical protein
MEREKERGNICFQINTEMDLFHPNLEQR